MKAMFRYIVVVFLLIASLAKAENDHVPMWLEVTPAPDEVYEGQGTEIIVRWHSRLHLNGFRSVQIEIPFFRNEGWHIYPKKIVNADAKNAIGLPVSGRRWIGKVSHIKEEDKFISLIEFAFVAVPKVSGKLELGEAKVEGFYKEPKNNRNKWKFRSQYPSYFNNNLFNEPDLQEEYELRSCALNLSSWSVNSLPTEGRPTDFTGIVGAFALDVHAEPLKVRAGDPITYHIRFTDHPFPFLLELPSLQQNIAFSRQFKFPDKSPDRVIEKEQAIYYRTIRPISEAVTQVPSLVIPYFNPKTKQYAYARSTPIGIETLPSDKVTQTDFEFSPDVVLINSVHKNESGIWTIEMNPEGANIKGTANYPLFLLSVPPLCLLCFRIFSTDYRLKKTDPVRYDQKHAYRYFLEDLKKSSNLETDLEMIIRQFIGRKYALNPLAHSIQDLETLIDLSVRNELRSIYRELERIRFEFDAKIDPEIVQRVKKLVQQIEGGVQ